MERSACLRGCCEAKETNSSPAWCLGHSSLSDWGPGPARHRGRSPLYPGDRAEGPGRAGTRGSRVDGGREAPWLVLIPAPLDPGPPARARKLQPRPPGTWRPELEEPVTSARHGWTSRTPGQWQPQPFSAPSWTSCRARAPDCSLGLRASHGGGAEAATAMSFCLPAVTLPGLSGPTSESSLQSGSSVEAAGRVGRLPVQHCPPLLRRGGALGPWGQPSLPPASSGLQQRGIFLGAAQPLTGVANSASRLWERPSAPEPEPVRKNKLINHNDAAELLLPLRDLFPSA